MHLGELENEQFFLDLWNATAFSRFIATLHARDNTASPPLRNISFHTFPYLSKKPLFKISHLLLAIFEAKIDVASAGRIDRQTRNPRRWWKRRKALTIGSLAGQIIEREREREEKTTHHRPVWNPLIPWCEKNLFHVSLSLGKAVTKHWTSNATVSPHQFATYPASTVEPAIEESPIHTQSRVRFRVPALRSRGRTGARDGEEAIYQA